MKPPPEIDNSKVLYWAWSEDKPFYIMPAIHDSEANAEKHEGIEICGLAVCLLEGQIYRYSCDRNWEVQNDTDYETVQEAMDAHYYGYENQPIHWNKYDDTDIDALMANMKV